MLTLCVHVGLSGIERGLARLDRLMQSERDCHDPMDPLTQPADEQTDDRTRHGDARTDDGGNMSIDLHYIENSDGSFVAVNEDNELAFIAGDDGSKNSKTLPLNTDAGSNDPQPKELTAGEHLRHIRMTSSTRLDDMVDGGHDSNDPFFTFAPTLEMRRSVSARWDNHVCIVHHALSTLCWSSKP